MEKSFWRGSGWGRMVAQINGGDGRACERAVGQAGKRAGGNGQARGRSSECGHTRMRAGALAAGERTGRESGARERADSGDKGIRGRLNGFSGSRPRARAVLSRAPETRGCDAERRNACGQPAIGRARGSGLAATQANVRGVWRCEQSRLHKAAKCVEGADERPSAWTSDPHTFVIG